LSALSLHDALPICRTAQCALHLIEQAERRIRITAEAEGNAEPDEGKGEVRMAIGAPQELDRSGERGQYAGHLTHPERRVAERGERARADVPGCIGCPLERALQHPARLVELAGREVVPEQRRADTERVHGARRVRITP